MWQKHTVMNEVEKSLHQQTTQPDLKLPIKQILDFEK